MHAPAFKILLSYIYKRQKEYVALVYSADLWLTDLTILEYVSYF